MPDDENDSYTPLHFFQEIQAARSIGDLRSLDSRMLDTVRFAIRTGTDTRSVVQLISRLNAALTMRLIDLLDSNEGISLPEGATYLALGSEGRGEQTLCTDQDSAIVYLDCLPPEKIREVERFAGRFVDALAEIGIPRCPGNIMASSPQWCHSLGEWKLLLDEWTAAPTPEHMLYFCMFQDLRALYGNEALAIELRDHILTAVRLSPSFFPNMACHAVRFPAPLTIFGRIRVERNGEHRGKVDIKKAGIFAITVGASLLALEAGHIGGNTWEKLELLGRLRIITPGDLKTVREAFTSLVEFRLQCQLRELETNGTPTNLVDPLAMTDEERRRFRKALKGVHTFLGIMNTSYQLNFISH